MSELDRLNALDSTLEALDQRIAEIKARKQQLQSQPVTDPASKSRALLAKLKAKYQH